MSNIDISILESSLKNDKYNNTLLSIISAQYVSQHDQVSLHNLIDKYRSDLACPAAIKHILAEACLKLSAYETAIALLENSEDAQSLLLKARCYDHLKQSAPLRKESNVIPFQQPALTLVKESMTTFQDVGGLAEVKKQITRRIIAPFMKPGIFQRFKRRAGGGILLYGPPGCGKTLLARATAGECNARFYNVMLTDILSKWVGESERNLHDIFETARENTPAIIFFDEIESIASRRNYDANGAATSASLVSLFLTELDGFSQNNDGVLILGATNIPWSIDNAFLRPGRFDREFFVPPPDHIARSAILKNVLTDKPCADDVDIEFMAKHTTGFSGADLKHLVELAEDEAIDKMLSGEDEITLDNTMFKAALKKASPSTLEWLAIARNYVEFSNETGKYDDIKQFLKTYERKR